LEKILNQNLGSVTEFYTDLLKKIAYFLSKLIVKMNKKNREKILVTGCAGFIGMHLCKSLLEDNYVVFGVDNINDYYDPKLKKGRLNILKRFANFKYKKVDITDLKALNFVFQKYMPSKVINLAAQAGVRYSIDNPQAYIDSNIVGFMNVLDCCKIYNVEGFIYASSSSVYGGSNRIPFSEKNSVDNPFSIYAVTKKSNELMARAYYNLYNLKSTGLRFFTVYGPWGRPDMAYYIFTKRIINNEPIKIFNYGVMKRDFTYIEDIVIGIKEAIIRNYECEVINLGNSKSENLLDMLKIIEDLIGKNADIKLEPMQLGDVKNTYADISRARNLLSFVPKTDLKDGLNSFVKWYIKHYER
jgi:UDP-glucuronate 4-epimerase